MTPSFMGRMAMMLPGVRPSISFASLPTASTFPVFWLIATMEGSFTTIPFPFAKTIVFAVPRSIARSLEKRLKSERGVQLILRTPDRSRNAGLYPPLRACWKSQLDSILAALLHAVHGTVRVPDELLPALAVVREGSDSDGRRDTDAEAERVEKQPLRDRGPDPLGDACRAVQTGLRE